MSGGRGQFKVQSAWQNLAGDIFQPKWFTVTLMVNSCSVVRHPSTCPCSKTDESSTRSQILFKVLFFNIISIWLRLFVIHPNNVRRSSEYIGLANHFEGAFQNCLLISKKSFRVPMRVSKNKIRCCSLPKLILFTALLLLLTIIY